MWLSRKGSYRSDLRSFASTPTYHQKRASNHSMSRIRRFSWRESPYLREILYLILTENSFQYYGIKYLQTHGTAMGKKIAVAFAKIYMARIENQILRQSCTEPIEPEKIYRRLMCFPYGKCLDKIESFVEKTFTPLQNSRQRCHKQRSLSRTQKCRKIQQGRRANTLLH